MLFGRNDSGLGMAASRIRAYEMAVVLAAALGIALSSRLVVPFFPVPVTAQTLAVLLTGVLLGPQLAAASVSAYLLAGVAGLPVFAAGAGPAYLLGPTGGYLLGFLPAAFVAGQFRILGWSRQTGKAVAALVLADAAIFACGLAWLAMFVPVKGLLAAGLLPFVPGECLKIALATIVLRRTAQR